MHRRRWEQGVLMAIALLAGILTVGCSTTTPAAPPSASTTQSDSAPLLETPLSENVSMGQTLPISAQVKIGTQLVQLEVAQTPTQQAMGLMFRKDLDPNRGMLFPFIPARPVAFWMKDTLISLDMVFLYGGKVVSISSHVPPCKTATCPVYGPKVLVDQVIELRAGRAAELGIKPGDRLTVQSL